MRPNGSFVAVLALALSVGAPLSLTGQSRTTSALRGTVMQTDSIPVTGAQVTIRHIQLGTQRTTTSDRFGRYAITMLQPGGPYEVVVSILGFADRLTERFMLKVGEQRLLNVTVKPDALQLEGVTVTLDRAGVFGAEEVGPATRIDEREMDQLPILSRDLMDLALTSPFVTKTEGGGFSVIGSNDRYNAVLVDGVSNKDAFGLTPAGVPGGQAGARILPLDAIAQYEVMVAPFDVRLSGFTGGVMNAVTRTGTNTWRSRGSVTVRAESLVGDLQLPTGAVAASGVERKIYSFSLGGPIKLDRAHFFFAAEHEQRSQPPDGFNLERDDPGLVRISPEALSSFQNFLTGLGLDGGTAGPDPLDTNLTNLFGRVDWSFEGGNRLSVRNVFSRSESAISPNRAQFKPYELSSNTSFRTSLNNTISAQFFSDFGTRGGNELTVTVQRTEDSDEPVSRFPQIGADLISTINETALRREIRAGAQFFAQDFDLKQTRFEVTDAVTLVNPSSTWSLGGTLAYQRISHRFLPGALGDYFFSSDQDLLTNAPQRFQRNVLLPGFDPTVNFGVLQWGVFFQNQIEAAEGVTLHFGARLDAPYIVGNPGQNAAALDGFGLDTSKMPSGNITFSPRFGFNIQKGDRLRTQVRAGIGMFAGQMPYVWLSNAFHNNGLRSVVQVCEGRRTDDPLTGNTAPAYDPNTLPDTCLFGDPTEVRTVVAFRDDFKQPQNLRVMLAVDQELSEDVSFSLAGVYSQAIEQIEIRDLNIGRPSSDPGPLDGYGNFDRRFFGRPVTDGFAQNPIDPTFDHVLVIGNERRSWSVAVTSELRGRVLDRFDFRAGYTFNRSFDTRSLTFNDMISNFGFTPTSQDPNQPTLGRSDFDRPHKIVMSLSGAFIPGLPNTDISLLYTGQSGVPFSYVYEGDLNGDGFPGLGGAFDRFNDLIYVPEQASELPSSLPTQGLLSNALRNDACLAANLGRLLKRNACRSPWQNRLDLRVSHAIDLGGKEIRFEGDLINLLNLVNSNWGRIETTTPNLPLIRPVARGRPTFGSSSRVGELRSIWSGAVLPSRDEDGKLRPSTPWSVRSPDSQWQAQFTMRVTLGG
jgi:Carboxypeptidase regulatory-like domain